MRNKIKLHFIPMNEKKTVFNAVKVLADNQSAIVVGEYIPATCVVAYCNRNW